MQTGAVPVAKSMAPRTTSAEKAEYNDRVNFVMLNVDNDRVKLARSDALPHKVDGIPLSITNAASEVPRGSAIGATKLIVSENLSSLMN
jgi:hypothetical protein